MAKPYEWLLLVLVALANAGFMILAYSLSSL
jgi:hypothetical protein